MLAHGASEKHIKKHVSVQKGEVYSLVQRVFHSIYTKIVFVLSVIGTLIIATFTRGEHVTIFAYVTKWLEAGGENASVVAEIPQDLEGLNRLLAPYYLKDWIFYYLVAGVAPFFSHLFFAGFLVLKYNVLQSDKREDWKCQPNREVTFKQMMGGLSISMMNMAIAGLISSTIACYIMNGGKSKMYYDVHERGIPYLILSAVGLFILLEGAAYYIHRIYHIPFIYKTIHKWHHWYQYPTAFHAIVFHPIEFVNFQLLVVCPPFLFPVHVGLFIAILLWQYYYGLVDHSGIDMSAPIWPWQPTVRYHDYHHKAFHVNLGFNLYLFDWLHDTYYKGDRIYTEDNFDSAGKKIEKDD